jgi:hypothetical protein
MKRMRWCDMIMLNLFWLGLNVHNNAVGTINTFFASVPQPVCHVSRGGGM